MEQTPDHETDLSLRQVSDRHGIELHFLFTKKLKIDRGKFEGCEGRLGLFIHKKEKKLLETFWMWKFHSVG